MDQKIIENLDQSVWEQRQDEYTLVNEWPA
ncbi:MAG: hypothetical protein RJB15_1489, partial [Pseudomonadota bacterium]